MSYEDVQFSEDELCLNATINTFATQHDHVKIILKWEKDPRSAVVFLNKITEDMKLTLFSAAQEIVDGVAWDDEEIPE